MNYGNNKASCNGWSKSNPVFVGFLLVAGFFLLAEHRAQRALDKPAPQAISPTDLEGHSRKTS